jgi:hypothetical protein
VGFCPCGPGLDEVDVCPCGPGSDEVDVCPCGPGLDKVDVCPCGPGSDKVDVCPCGSGSDEVDVCISIFVESNGLHFFILMNKMKMRKLFLSQGFFICCFSVSENVSHLKSSNSFPYVYFEIFCPVEIQS